MLRRFFVAAVVAAATVGLTTSAVAQESLADQVAQLEVAAEHPAGYNRDALNINYDRDEVLAANRSAFPNCDGYYSRYDGQCYASEDAVQIDHLVAIAEAWQSGGYQWSQSQWENFDGDASNLAVMTSDLNSSKGADDVTAWLPPRNATVCQYVSTVVSVKLNYDLTVDSAEKAKLADLAARCGGGNPGGGGDSGGGQDMDCDDFQYREAAQAVFERAAEDIHRLDADGDGQACESLPTKPAGGGQDTDDVKTAPEPEPVQEDFAVTG